MAGGRFRELIKKYGKVALGVHISVSTASVAGLYVAIKNNVDVESMFEKVGLGAIVSKDEEEKLPPPQTNPEMMTDLIVQQDTVAVSNGNPPPKRNRTAEMVASSGGALALAVLCNKALFPVRVPITIALTPPISRFLARRQLFKNAL